MSYVLIMDEVIAEDSGPCDGCGKPVAINELFIQDEFTDVSNEFQVEQWHVKCFEIASER